MLLAGKTIQNFKVALKPLMILKVVLYSIIKLLSIGNQSCFWGMSHFEKVTLMVVLTDHTVAVRGNVLHQEDYQNFFTSDWIKF